MLPSETSKLELGVGKEVKGKVTTSNSEGNGGLVMTRPDSREVVIVYGPLDGKGTAGTEAREYGVEYRNTVWSNDETGWDEEASPEEEKHRNHVRKVGSTFAGVIFGDGSVVVHSPCGHHDASHRYAELDCFEGTGRGPVLYSEWVNQLLFDIQKCRERKSTSVETSEVECSQVRCINCFNRNIEARRKRKGRSQRKRKAAQQANDPAVPAGHREIEVEGSDGIRPAPSKLDVRLYDETDGKDRPNDRIRIHLQPESGKGLS